MQVIQTLIEDPWLEQKSKLPASPHRPESAGSLCRFLTFRSMWRSGYYLTDGSKFGGDFLVYCGDPVKYHAKYIVICLEDSQYLTDASTQQLVARCRLGAGVKKIVLFSWTEDDEVKFKSLTRGEEEEEK